MHLITLMGPPAVGKYTIGKLVAEQLGYKLFHNHLTVDLALSILDYGADGFFPLMADLRIRCFEAAASANVRGMVFTCAFAFPEAEPFATRIEILVKRNGGRCDLVRLTCPPEELERRVSTTERQKFGKIAEPLMLRSTIERYDLMNVLAGREALTVDTSSLSPGEASRIICDQLI